MLKQKWLLKKARDRLSMIKLNICVGYLFVYNVYSIFMVKAVSDQ